MAKRQIITGKRLRMLEKIIHLHTELLSAVDNIHNYRSTMEELRIKKKELQEKRNTLIREAVRKRVPMKQIGERLGLSKVAIHLINRETNEKTN